MSVAVSMGASYLGLQVRDLDQMARPSSVLGLLCPLSINQAIGVSSGGSRGVGVWGVATPPLECIFPPIIFIYNS